MRQQPIKLALFRGKRSTFRGFKRRDDLRVFFIQALIAFIGQTTRRLRQRRWPPTTDFDIVYATGIEGDIQHLQARQVDHRLAFQCMIFFLTAVVAALFFFGRSQGVSVASITTTSQVGSSGRVGLSGLWQAEVARADQRILNPYH